MAYSGTGMTRQHMVEYIQDRWNEGARASDIGREIGCTRNSVLGIVHRERAKGVYFANRVGNTISNPKPVRTRPVEALRAIRKPPENREPPKPLPKPDRSGPEPRNLTIDALTNSTCRWPVTDGNPHLFCGHKTVEGKVYCPHHLNRARPKS